MGCVKVGTIVFKTEDNGSILRMGKVEEKDHTSGLVRVRWKHIDSLVWEDVSDLE